MENSFYLCLFIAFSSSVSSHSVTITEDTVYIINKNEGQVTCTLNGNCGAIVWHLSSISEPIAEAFIRFSCVNKTYGFYQTCDDQNHQYTLYFTGTPTLHGQTITCLGEGCSPQKNVSDTVMVSIIYGPASISYQPEITSYTRNEGGNLGPIQCVSDCNPKCNFVWTRPVQSEYNGENLTISSITRTQEGDYKCTAKNSHGSISGSTISVVVNYGPVQVILTPSTNNYIVNETFQLGPIRCSATCKPACSYKWIVSNQNNLQSDILTINSINKTQTGTYKCQANNTIGSLNSYDVYVTVDYAAKLTKIEISDGNNFTIHEHSTKTISCLAEGLPNPTITLRYISNSSIIKSVNGLRLDFTFPLARCEDTGIYKCDAINKFTPQKPLQKNVFVLCKPRSAEELSQNGYTLSVGETLNIRVLYLAYPRPTFQWYKNDSSGSLVPITDKQEDVQINNSVINPYTFVTKLIRVNLQEDGFGTYILRSNNIIGSNEDLYIVGAKDVPDNGASTALTAGAGLGSAIVTIIIVAIVIFAVRRFKSGLTKSNEDVEMSRRSVITSGDEQVDGMRDNILYEPCGSYFVRPGTSDSPKVEISDGASGGDYPYAEVQDKPKKEKNPDLLEVYADVQKAQKENIDTKPKMMIKKGKAEKEKQGDLNVENVNKGNFAAADSTFVTKHNKSKPVKQPNAPKRNKDGLIYVDLDLEEPVTKPGQKLIIKGLKNRIDYVDIDVTRRGDPLPRNDKRPKGQNKVECVVKYKENI